MNQKHFLGYIWILLVVLAIFSCTERPDDREITDQKIIANDSLVNRLIESGLDYYFDGEYRKCQEVFMEARSLVRATDTVAQIQLLLNMTELLKRQGKFEECLTNYYKASKLAYLSRDSIRLGLSYYNLSSTYIALKRNEEAGKYNLKAQEVFKHIADTAKLMNCYVQYYVILREEHNNHLAKEYLSKATQFYEAHNQKRNFGICLNNFGNLLYDEKKYDEAIQYYIKAVSISRSLNAQFTTANRLGNIAEAYLRKQEPEAARRYIDSSMQVANKISAQETILVNLEMLAEYHIMVGNIDSVLKITDQVKELRTELLTLESTSVAQWMEEKYNNELSLSKANHDIELLEKDKMVTKNKKEQATLILYIIICIALLIVFMSYLLYRKQKRIRAVDLELHQIEHALLASNNQMAQIQLEIKEAEKKRLEEELDFKGQELITFSLNLSEREKLSTDLKTVLSKIMVENISSPDVMKELKRIQYNIINKGKAEVYNRIQELNSSFHFNLKTKFPVLTENDVRLASLLLIGLSSKEIATLLIIEPKSVDVKRYRLKKKLNLEPTTDLTVFLSNI